MSITSTVSRIIFNFNGKCNMNCPYCYIPFRQADGSLELWKDIILRCKQWKPKMIVFGGGDPFMFQGFRDLLRFSHDDEIFIHVDTNALALHPRDVQLIIDAVDQIGLPFDGTETSHAAMRKHPKHFAVVRKWLEELLNKGVRVKVNTVVSALNKDTLFELAEFLQGYPISQWCLYQFWPLEAGLENEAVFRISDDEYLAVAQQIAKKYSFTKIDIATVASRLSSHFFVSSTGVVYTEDINNVSDYIFLGSVFDDDILTKWQKYGNDSIAASRANFRMNVEQ